MLESASGDGGCYYTRTGVKEDTLGAYGTSRNISIRLAKPPLQMGFRRQLCSSEEEDDLFRPFMLDSLLKCAVSKAYLA